MRKHSACIATIITALCSYLAAAAKSDAIGADSLTHVLAPVTVTAEAPRSATSTAPMHVVTDAQMQRAGVTDVSDALHRMPGVTLRDYGGAGGLKTVSVRGFGAGHTGVFYDGVPLSDVQSGQIDLSRYSVDNVGSVGLTVGDNDDIFIPARSAASAATVSISSLPVTERSELCVKLRAGSFGLVNPYLRAGTPIGSKAAINFVGEYTRADNDYPFTLHNGSLVTREHRNNSGMHSGHAETNFLWQTSEASSLTAKIYYYDNRRHLPGPVIYYNDVSHERLREQNAMAQARWRSRLSTKLALATIIKYNFASSRYHDENGKYPDGVLDQNYWQREYYASASLLYTPTTTWLADYSADWSHNNLNSNLPTDSRPYRNSLLQSLTAKYKTSRLTVTARMLVSIHRNGARDGIAAKDATKASPSLSLSVQPVKSQLLYLRASYKNIFRMPTFNEAYFDHYGSTDVLPESTDQFNIGATYTASASAVVPLATFAIDGYINNITDMIVAVPYNMFIWRITNLGKVRTYGIDATAQIAVSPASRQTLSLSAAYSLQRAMPVTDPASSEWHKQVAYIPKHSGSLSVSYENPIVNVSVSGMGVTDRYTTNNNLPATRIDGYIECGASLWRDFTIRRIGLGIRADALNILDKQYQVVARYPMPGRHYRITVTLRL